MGLAAAPRYPAAMIRALVLAALVILPGAALASGWDAFGLDGAYQGRISGEGERGLPAVIGGEDAL